MIRKLAAFVACAILFAGCDQLELASLYIANAGTSVEVTTPLPLSLPYRDIDGWAVVGASVNGKAPVGFVLDTGASLIALIESDATRHLGLDMRNVKRLGADDDLAAPVGARQDGLSIDLGGVVLKDQTAFALSGCSLGCGKSTPPSIPFGGVIGHDLFRRFVVEVNRDKGLVTLHDPDAFQYGGAGIIVPVSISGRQPFVELPVTEPSGRRYQANFHIDSGAGISATLFPGSHPQIQLPSRGKTTESCFVGGRARYREGQPVQLAIGREQVTAPVEYALGREVIADGQHGRLGARFLARFNIIFDYANERLILEPRANSAEARGHGRLARW